jgi:hypothetical protein
MDQSNVKRHNVPHLNNVRRDKIVTLLNQKTDAAMSHIAETPHALLSLVNQHHHHANTTKIVSPEHKQNVVAHMNVSAILQSAAILVSLHAQKVMKEPSLIITIAVQRQSVSTVTTQQRL